MNLISIAERLASLSRSTVIFTSNRCLHSRDKFSTCEACFNLCPVGAIHPQKPPLFDPQACVNCLACLPACPVGAFSADDEVSALLDYTARIERKQLELICGRHPGAGTGPVGSDFALQIHGCLASLGSGTYLASAALGVEHVLVRLDACKGCEWGALREQIKKQVTEAGDILRNTVEEPRFSILEALEGEKVVERPIGDVHNPPISRRELFHLAAQQGQVAAARLMMYEQDGEKQALGRDRYRTLAAIQRLGPAPFEDSKPGCAGFAAIKISDACTACKACVRVCPTGALQSEEKGNHNFRLLFFAQKCIGCELCGHVCASEAISLNHSPSFREVFGSGSPECLLEIELTKCERCNTYFAARPGQKFCPVCEFRRANPFGSYLPSERKPGKPPRADVP